MYYSENYLEPFEDLPAEAYWRAIEDLHEHRRQRAAAFRRSLVSIQKLREKYLQNLYTLLGQEKQARYLKLIEQRSRNVQRLTSGKPIELKPPEQLTAKQVDTVREMVRFLEQVQNDFKGVRKLQRKYSSLISKAYQRHRRTVSRGQVVTARKLKRRNAIHLYSPFPDWEVDYNIDTTKPYEWHDVKARIDQAEGNLKHESFINIYLAGDSSHTYIENRLGFGTLVEAPSGWTEMHVKARYVNNHSCATWAQWDECGFSDYRQEFSCRGYIRVHGFYPFDNPLLKEENGLELRGASQGQTGNWILQSNGTIASVPPIYKFWEPGEVVETDLVLFQGPFHPFRYLIIWSGLDCSHLDDANDYSVYSDLMFDLRLQSIQVQFGS